MYSLPEPACLPAALYRDRLPLIIIKNAMLGRDGRCSRKKKRSSLGLSLDVLTFPAKKI